MNDHSQLSSTIFDGRIEEVITENYTTYSFGLWKSCTYGQN